jgi:hypothetical protein
MGTENLTKKRTLIKWTGIVVQEALGSNLNRYIG